ncbi:hypothetical protein Ciccas_010721 [Cichlidogyrus casuarinus]|uniref:N-acetylgalactosaminide beta-1,3-galactosyltransferase n=1 Tax=Cichlidogyrus casuarinus TaxID=1844966 RepID=A0ABD2PUH2_9PLAT
MEQVSVIKNKTKIYKNSKVSFVMFSCAALMCFILSQPSNIGKAKIVNSTWAPLCDGYVFVLGNATLPGLPSLNLPIVDSRRNLVFKTSSTILHMHKYFGHKYDFFLKADDDTYVLVNNLRYFMRDLDPEKKTIAGRHAKVID